MSHCIRVMMAADAMIKQLAASSPEAHILSLEQGFSLIPLTDALFDEVTGRYPNASGEDWEAFVMLSPAIQQWLKTQSQSGPIAYLETEYFGGEGAQSAILYEKGEVKKGPLESKRPGAINRVLQAIGVKKSLGKDAFDTIGLGNFRSNEDILETLEQA